MDAKTFLSVSRCINALAIVVDQAHNAIYRPLLRAPTAKLPFGWRLTLSDRFYTPTLIRPDNEREGGTCHKLGWICRQLTGDTLVAAAVS